MRVADGTEADGICYKAWLDAPDYKVRVMHPDGRVLFKKFRWSFEPRCGIDAADLATIEQAMEEMINELRQS